MWIFFSSYLRHPLVKFHLEGAVLADIQVVLIDLALGQKTVAPEIRLDFLVLDKPITLLGIVGLHDAAVLTVEAGWRVLDTAFGEEIWRKTDNGATRDL